MRNITILCFKILFILPFWSNAQTDSCSCNTELDRVSELIKESKSYKQQIKGKKEKEYEIWQTLIREDIKADPDIDSYCLGYLQKYVWFIKDSHNRIRHLNPLGVEKIPTYEANFVEIEKKYLNKRREDIEGIYHSGKEKLVLVKSSKAEWKGVMLASESDLWSPGMVKFKIRRTDQNKMEMLAFTRSGKIYYKKNVYFKEGRIYPTYWNKDNTYHFHNEQPEIYNFKSIDESIDYISITSFDRTRALMTKAASFYEKTLPKLNKPYLILDFRNNGGGAVLQAAPLVKSIKKNRDIKKIFVIINFVSGSATEITTSKLMTDPRVTVVGENSRGGIAYGYGNSSKYTEMSCFNYATSFTVKNSGKGLLQYEETGITPSIYLDLKQDWLQQTIDLISKAQ